jgi:hypothetical protein
LLPATPPQKRLALYVMGLQRFLQQRAAAAGLGDLGRIPAH